MPIERIEVYLDNVAEPVQVLKQPPFKVSYDTRSLPDGEHTLRVETYYTGGAKEIKEIPFKVANTPGVLVQGLEEGKEVSGNLDVTLRVADPDIKPARDRFPGMAAVVTTVLLLGGIWLFFAATGVTNKPLEEVAKPPVAAKGESSTPAAGAPVDQVLKTKGEGVFAASCAGCHQASGQGLAGTFPPLAANPNLADVSRVVTTIIKGRTEGVEVKGVKYTQPMPGFAQLSDEEVAAVATYVRNAWGNAYGGVTPQEAKAAR